MTLRFEYSTLVDGALVAFGGVDVLAGAEIGGEDVAHGYCAGVCALNFLKSSVGVLRGLVVSLVSLSFLWCVVECSRRRMDGYSIVYGN